jgi:arsenate reductase
MKVYGITNCNTVKKALDWLKQNGIAYEFHDFKKLGVTEAKLKEWAAYNGWESLINKKGTTWRSLDPKIQNSVTSDKAAFALMQEKTSVIKRPVLEKENTILFGFDEDAYKRLFLK